MERKRENNWRKIALPMIAFVVICLLIILIFISSDSIDTITALDGRTLADSISADWNSSAQLIQVDAVSPAQPNGESGCWRFIYTNNASSYENIVNLAIEVFPDGKYNHYILPYSSTSEPITNWHIDSDVALSIAYSNEDISLWLSDNPGSSIGKVSLHSISNVSTWHISFLSEPYFGGGFQEIIITIDATTGEVRDMIKIKGAMRAPQP